MISIKSLSTFSRNTKVFWIVGVVLLLTIGGLVYSGVQFFMPSFQLSQSEQELDDLNSSLTKQVFESTDLQENLLAVEQITTLVDPEIDQTESELNDLATQINEQNTFDSTLLITSDLE